ncbi:MAG: cell wall-binding repeat-containing protein [Oscillospiraceae bacterium]|jgi:putative cell wall-binding protein/N-acetylmuramoyl-L-alanine amidase|nr:cell wall-binding repeat-containing protein [Oscillospiraceae bacterium]
MKKYILPLFLVLALLLSAVPAIGSSAASNDLPVDGTTPYFATASLNSGSDIYRHAKVEKLTAGTLLTYNTVNIVGKTTGWYKITYGSDYAFIPSSKLTTPKALSNVGVDTGKIPCNSDGTLTKAQSIYSIPSVNGAVIGSLKNGEKIHITYRLPNGWVKLNSGYIPESSLKNITATSFVNNTGIITVLLDPGHGGTDSGAVNSKLGVKESVINLKVANYTKQELERYANVRILMGRTSDAQVMLDDRFNLAFENHADIYFSQHFNAGGGTGAECYISQNSRFAPTALANNVLSEIAKIGVKNGGVKIRKKSDETWLDYYKFIRWSTACGQYSILVEHCYMDSSDSKYISSEATMQKFGIADATAIAKTYGLKLKKPLTGISISPTSVSVYEGRAFTPQVAFTPSDTTDSKALTWSTSNANVASLAGDTIIANKSGTATVTAKSVNGLTAVITVTVKPPAAGMAVVKRFSGANRYETSKEIFKNGWGERSENIVLASGNVFADALCATPIAYKLDAPIILVEYQSTWIADYLKSAGCKNVVIMGGSSAISAQTQAELEAAGYNVRRISGSTRYETSLEAAEYLYELNGEVSPSVALVTGTGFADSVSFGAVAAVNSMPIIYTNTSGLSSEALQLVSGSQKAYLVGGEASVPKRDEAEFLALGDDKEVIRLAGSNRYETSVAIVKAFKADFGNEIAFAAGSNFPDALAGGAFAAKRNMPLLIVNPSSTALLDSAKSFIKSININTVYFVGGESMVPTKPVMEAVDWNAPKP